MRDAGPLPHALRLRTKVADTRVFHVSEDAVHPPPPPPPPPPTPPPPFAPPVHTTKCEKHLMY